MQEEKLLKTNFLICYAIITHNYYNNNIINKIISPGKRKKPINKIVKILIGILKLTNWPNTFKTYIETTPIIIDLNMSLSNDITIILYAYFIIKYDKTK